MMLDVNHVYKTFHPGTINERRALAGVDLHLEEGDFVTVIGGNGAGKSTLLNPWTAARSSLTGTTSPVSRTISARRSSDACFRTP